MDHVGDSTLFEQPQCLVRDSAKRDISVRVGSTHCRGNQTYPELPRLPVAALVFHQKVLELSGVVFVKRHLSHVFKLRGVVKVLDAMLRLSVPAALLLGACAPDIGMFTRDPLDQCAKPNIISSLVEGLHRTPGMSNVSLRDVSTTELNGADTSDAQLGDPAPWFVCHASLVLPNGTTSTGRIVVSDNFRKITWTSDADYQKRFAAMAAQRRERQAQLEQQKIQFKADQALLARCDPKVKAPYDAAISQLSNETAEYMQLSHANESAQMFVAQNDISRQSIRLQAERVQACRNTETSTRR
jgi:hypothetical protein